MKKNLFVKLLATNLLIVVLTLGVLGVFLSQMVEDYFLEQEANMLVAKGQEMGQIISGYMVGNLDEMTAVYLLTALDGFIGARIWVVDRKGQILLDSQDKKGPSPIRGMRLNPEDIRRVMEGNLVIGKGENPMFGFPVVSAAVPIYSSNHPDVLGAVFLHAPVTGILATSAQIQKLLLWAILLATPIAAALSYFFSRHLSRPLGGMNRIALRMAQGDFNSRIPVASEDEVGQLAGSLNYMAEKLQATIQDLNQEKSKFQSMVTSMQEGVIGVDEQGRLILINPSAQSLLGIEEAQALGSPVTTTLLPPEIGQLLQEVLNQGEARTATFSPSPQKVLLVHVSPTHSGEAAKGGAVALLQDISETAKLERMRRDFVANVSHDLRTPLTAIRGFVEPLLDGTVDDETTRRRYLEIIRQETLRLNRLIQDLLDLSRLEAGKAQLRQKPLDLGGLLRRTADNLRPLAEKKGIDLILQLPSALAPVLGDEDRLEQVCINLMDNALQYTSPGGQVRVEAREEGDLIRAEIHDTGQGIPPEDIPLVWERFYKVDKSRTRGESARGTGLGLAIVKHIIEAHNGQVAVESQLGEGSTFAFLLPKA